MAKTKERELGVATREDVLGNGESDEVDDPIELIGVEDKQDKAEIDEIKSIISDLDAGGTVRLERKGPFDSVFAYIQKIPVKQFDIDIIKNMYGGGEYKAKTFRSNGQMYRPFSFSIDNRIKGRLDESQIKDMAEGKDDSTMRKAADLAMSMVKSTPDNSDMFLKMMQMQGHKSDQMMTLMMTQMQNSMQMMVTMMTQSQQSQASAGAEMMKAMAMMNSNKSGPDFATSLTPVLVEMIRSRGSEKSDLSQFMEMFSTFKELTGGEKEDRSLTDKIIDVAGPVLMGLFGRMGQGSGMPAQMVIPQIPQQVSQPVVDHEPETQNESMKLLSLVVGQLFKAADKGSDPTLYADLIVDVLTDQQYVELIQALTLDDWKVKLFGQDVRAQKHGVWLDELRKTLLNYDNNQVDGSEQLKSNATPV